MPSVIAREFNEVTVLHGFGYLSRSKTWIESAIFIVLMICSVIMLTRDAAVLVEQYQSEPTNTNMLVMHNLSFTIDKPTICIGTENLAPDNNLTASDISMAIEVVKRDWANISELKRQVFDSSFNVSDWLVENEDGLFLVFTSLIQQSGNEVSFLDDDILISTKYSNETMPIKEMFKQQNVDYRQLINVISHVFCLRAEIQVGKVGKMMSSAEFCNKAKLTWFGPTDVHATDGSQVSTPMICYQSPMNFEFSKTHGDFTVIRLRMRQHLYQLFRHSTWIELQGRKTFFNGESSATGIRNVYAVAGMLLFDMQSLNRNIQPCSTTEMRLDCMLGCVERHIRSALGCFPVLLWSDTVKPSGMPYCTGITNSSDPDAVRSCFSKCPSECYYRSFLTFNSEESTVPYDPDYQTVSICFSQFVYPSFQETYQMTWQNMLMSFGGSIGLWLGASWIGFIHVPIFFLAAIATKWTNRQSNTQNSASSKEIYSVSDGVQ